MLLKGSTPEQRQAFNQKCLQYLKNKNITVPDDKKQNIFIFASEEEETNFFNQENTATETPTPKPTPKPPPKPTATPPPKPTATPAPVEDKPTENTFANGFIQMLSNLADVLIKLVNTFVVVLSQNVPPPRTSVQGSPSSEQTSVANVSAPIVPTQATPSLAVEAYQDQSNTA